MICTFTLGVTPVHHALVIFSAIQISNVGNTNNISERKFLKGISEATFNINTLRPSIVAQW